MQGSQNGLRNQRGQMAVFVALIFQVLFVFFAMALNVALFVHDKINLQNSVDLAAYYAAQKQAEWMNVIAHQNYMIRQSWKLLVWRYRVIGAMGLERNFPHPARGNGRFEPPFNRQDVLYDPGYANKQISAVCVTYAGIWPEINPQENLCNQVGLNIPRIPVFPVIAAFNPINLIMNRVSQQLQSQFDQACRFHGVYNWWYGASIMAAFREDQRNRKMVIRHVQKIMTGANGNFMDIDGQSVKDTAFKTLNKNLTFANRNPGPEFEMFNSLESQDPKKWLVDIQVFPTLYYIDSPDAPGPCTATPRVIEQPPIVGAKGQMLDNTFDKDKNLRNLTQQVFFTGNMEEYNYTLGMEKNPWIQAYVGVKASTSPRQLFFPFGPTIKLTARAFAKPFGGRVGPWYGRTWGKDAGFSTGAKIDANLPPRKLPGANFTPVDDLNSYPNYSRYPGDPLGMTSRAGLASLTNLGSMRLYPRYFEQISAKIEPNNTNDILMWDNQSNQNPPLSRGFEIAAITPDLFDLTYYSVIPNFEVNYLGRIVAARNQLAFPGTMVIRGDLGGHNENVNSITTPMSMQRALQSVLQGQIAGPNPFAPENYFMIRDRKRVLSGWAPGPGTFDYPEEPQWFLDCEKSDDEGVKVVGSCAARGGRVGYSVKLISRDLLVNEMVAVGGLGGSPAEIVNKPPEEF